MMMSSFGSFGNLNLLGELIFIGDDLQRLFVMQCIQVTLLALCIWPLAKLFAASRPHLAHALWGLVLIKCLTPPIFALPYSPFCNGDVHAWLRIPSEAPKAIEPEIESRLPISVANTPDTATTSLSPDSSPSMVRISPTIIEVDTGSPESEHSQNPSSENSAFQVLVALSLIVWISGSLLSLTAVAWKLHRFLKNVRCRHVTPLPATIQSLNDLLNDRSAAPNQTVPNRRSVRSTRSCVRVEIVDCDIGPAVVGWLRPRILIPRLLEQACTPDQLRMLMAHELTHVRRGDLRWALIQTLAGCVWWFHPLIRIVVRRFELETERSCDAETVARLGCSPAEYARGLLSVLEFKHRLRAAPALPGVRPIDLTQKRMEQIMRLQNGIKRERSWFVFFVMVIGALVALPGAAWVSAQQPDDKPLSAAEPQVVFIPDTGAERPTPLPRVSLGSNSKDEPANNANEPETLRVYHIGKVLDAMQADEKCDRDTAMTLAYFHFLAEVGLDRTQAASKIKSDLANESLIVRGSAKLHTALTEIIERINKFGLAQVSVGTQIVSLERGKLESFELDWNYASNLEKNDPVLIAVLSKADRDQLITKLQADPRTNILQTPRVTLFNGQQATISDVVQRAFAGAPVSEETQPAPNRNEQSEPAALRMVKEGIELTMQPTVTDRMSSLKLKADFSEILDTRNFRYKSQGKVKQLPIPNIEQRHVDVNVTMPDGQILALAVPGFRKSKFDIMLLIQVQRIADVDGAVNRPAEPIDKTKTSEHKPSVSPHPQALTDDQHAKLSSRIQLGENVASDLGVVGTIVPAEKSEELSSSTKSDGAKTQQFIFDQGRIEISASEVSFANGAIHIRGNPAYMVHKARGFTASADEIKGSGDHWLFNGHARLTSGDNVLTADTIRVGDRNLIDLTGNVRILGQEITSLKNTGGIETHRESTELDVKVNGSITIDMEKGTIKNREESPTKVKAESDNE